ncbi:MAG: hypothetical protein AAGJ28_17185 [Pseudomonadota bacterium]
MQVPQPIIVTGYPGSGKTRIAERLTGPVRVVEEPGFSTPAADGCIVTVVDGVNAAASLQDAFAGPLIRAQIEAADCVVISRSDVVDVRPVADLVAPLTGQPVLDAHRDAITAETVSTLPRPGPRSEPLDLTDAFAIWDYRGPAVLTLAAAEALLEHRPAGIWRIAGTIRLPEGGLDAQVFGRGRQTQKIDAPSETVIRALGPKGAFTPRDMDRAFAEAVMNASYDQGMIACR